MNFISNGIALTKLDHFENLMKRSVPSLLKDLTSVFLTDASGLISGSVVMQTS